MKSIQEKTQHLVTIYHFKIAPPEPYVESLATFHVHTAMEPIGDNQDHSYYRESSESILEKNHDEQGLSTDSGLKAIKAKENDVLLLEELLLHSMT